MSAYHEILIVPPHTSGRQPDACVSNYEGVLTRSASESDADKVGQCTLRNVSCAVAAKLQLRVVATAEGGLSFGLSVWRREY
jgi:hypothetical protein